jgi:hypothetical protein
VTTFQTRHPPNLSELLTARARFYLGYPYCADTLIGSDVTQEEFVCRRDAFDCVTFVESVFAEILSEVCSTQFVDELRSLRYRNGIVSWDSRLHYFSDWLTTHTSRGVLREVFPELPVTHRVLSWLPNYPAQEADIRFLPLGDLPLYQSQLQRGDLIAFGTSRTDLDVSHVGFFNRSEGDVPMLIHATKARGSVVEEALCTFLDRFGETPGLLVYRPTVSAE